VLANISFKRALKKCLSCSEFSSDTHIKAESFTLTISFAKCLFILGAASEFALGKVNFFFCCSFDDPTRRLYCITYPFLAASFIPFAQSGAVLSESQGPEKRREKFYTFFSCTRPL